MYQLLLYVHILCAVIWVGGAAYLQLLALLVSRSDDPMELPRLGRHAEVIGTRVFMPTAVILFVAGLLMALDRWSIAQAWILGAIGLWALSAVAGAVYLGPSAKRADALFASEGPTSPAGRQTVGRMFLVSRVELLSFAVIIALMVFKPGA